VKQGHRQRGAAWAAVVTAVLLLAALAPVTRAGASPIIKASVVGSESVSSGTWAATASTTSFTFFLGLPTFTLWACPVAWVANQCSGGPGTQVGSTLASGSTTTVTSAVVPPLGGTVYLQLEPAGTLFPVTVTLSTLITSPTELRAAVKTNH